MKYLCCIERKTDEHKLPHLGLGWGVTKLYFLPENCTSDAAAGVCSFPGDAQLCPPPVRWATLLLITAQPPWPTAELGWYLGGERGAAGKGDLETSPPAFQGT